MSDYLDDSWDELKRVDHQIYVSLKYTRTVDVLLNIMRRMIDAYDLMWEHLLNQAKENELINQIPFAPREKVHRLKELHHDTTIHENIDLYLLLRRLVRSTHDRENEYRRHVTMITYIDGQQEIINIDIITQYYQMQRDFISYLRKIEDD